MKKYKHIIIGAVILAVLAGTLWWGGDSPGLHGFGSGKGEKEHSSQIQTSDMHIGEEVSPETNRSGTVGENTIGDSKTEGGTKTDGDRKADENPKNTVNSNQTDLKDNTESEGSVSSSDSEKDFTCTLSVSCGTILNNLSRLEDGKASAVPANGVLFAEKTVVFYEGETVFNLIVREMKSSGIHLEFVTTPIYNSAYIEGIGNIYEFDCGELSGWMYRVNGKYPDYGCSQYQLKPGDKVEWLYTCNGGEDIGGRNSAK